MQASSKMTVACMREVEWCVRRAKDTPQQNGSPISNNVQPRPLTSAVVRWLRSRRHRGVCSIAVPAASTPLGTERCILVDLCAASPTLSPPKDGPELHQNPRSSCVIRAALELPAAHTRAAAGETSRSPTRMHLMGRWRRDGARRRSIEKKG